MSEQSSWQIQRQLLQYLSDGQFYSGSWLGEQLSLSRTAIANHMQQLQQLGLDIFSVKGKGYRLASPLQLLDGAAIRQWQSSDSTPIEVLSITDSTNLQLMQRLQRGETLPKGLVLVAEAQTAGRGRHGRAWYSPFAASLSFSMVWQLEQGIQAAMGLSLVIGVAVSELLEQDYQLPVALKWPNDIYLQGKKLAGVLIELSGQSDGRCQLVIGIGINVQLSAAQAAQRIDQPWIDLTTALGSLDRNRLVARLQASCVEHLQRFEQSGFAAFQAAFNRRQLFLQQPVRLTQGQQVVRGICHGVDAQGNLVIESQGKRQLFHGGELSLRAEN
ncbi:bifunctional biotin--[acetyl-CoA-carboxylase] ligase/biotin operon repressor BirA [Alkalimonas sp.]|uniref:bifunctional biotin--[acetyl-CoA-carboxylase] ligase/biotin operon repressor BirA n=1 Tax=Alkalimonas sp. TaxID=1872453 RepID=UPI00263BC49A|nr:bifunctional biotin--[acetyl-CoA-carboxylase] ligase/biotin operon repressor BirA [Alkalimonas sp.]MCC5825596.1 bifunctional biotin--[acetyl-CoA-carboxylase] ligase/biotin operon repressor BirA [Alkalimonas sp.]